MGGWKVKTDHINGVLVADDNTLARLGKGGLKKKKEHQIFSTSRKPDLEDT